MRRPELIVPNGFAREPARIVVSAPLFVLAACALFGAALIGSFALWAILVASSWLDSLVALGFGSIGASVLVAAIQRLRL